VESVRCNVCDEIVITSAIEQHLAGRNHSIKKKVAEFQEMNALARSSYQNDTSVVKAWIKDLYAYDFLSTGRT